MDASAYETLRRDLDKMGWPWEELLDHAEAAPRWWAALPWNEAFRRLRWTTGLTQAEVARRAGVAQSFVSRFERGRIDVRVSQLRRLYAALGRRACVISELDGSVPRVDPRKEKSPLDRWLDSMIAGEEAAHDPD